MADTNENWPEEGELLVCTVSNVRENGAYPVSYTHLTLPTKA